MRVLWTYLCRFWEHFILINIIHGLVHSLGLPEPLDRPPPATLSILLSFQIAQHGKFVTVLSVPGTLGVEINGDGDGDDDDRDSM